MAKAHLQQGLRTKIVAWSFIPTAIILSAVAWFTFYSYQKVLVDQAIKQDRTVVVEKANEAIRAIADLLNPTVLPIFLEIDIHHEESLEVRAENILNKAKGLEIFDGGIYFLDGNGKVFRTQPALPELIGEDWSDTPQFRYLQEHTNVAAFTDLRSVGSSGKKVVCAAMAMIGQKTEAVGAVFFCFIVYPATQNPYYQKLSSLDLGSNLYMLDGNQKVVFSADPSEMGKDLSGETYIQQLLQGGSEGGRFRIGTEDRVVSYVRVSDDPGAAGWIVLKEQSLAEAMQATQAYRQFLLILLALGVIVPALVTAYGVRHITDPIQKLIRASEQVTAGQFKHRIEVNTGDEIETLADQFNLMSAKLDDSYSSLEKRVADRTRELAIINSIISVASHSLDVREILEDALNKTVEQMGFEAGVAFKFEPHRTTPLLMAQWGFEPTTASNLMHSYAIAGQEGPAIYPKEVTTFGIEDFQDEQLRNQLSQFNLHLLVYVPLSTKGRELGFFILGKHEAGELSLEEVSLLNSIGQQIGVAMENAHLYEQAEQAATVAERQRLARELHDAVTQTLFSANLIADVIPRIWERNPEEGLQNLQELRQLTRGALAEMRTMLLEMRPESLERADIKSLLTQLADAFIGRVRVPVQLEINGNCELPHEVKIVFYRVAQEALNNIAKHSGARQVDVQLECQPVQLSLCIKDDGLGFELDSLPPGHLGIAIMRERASSIGACLKIESRLGRGTTVELDWRSGRKDGTDEHFSDDPRDASG